MGQFKMETLLIFKKLLMSFLEIKTQFSKLLLTKTTRVWTILLQEVD